MIRLHLTHVQDAIIPTPNEGNHESLTFTQIAITGEVRSAASDKLECRPLDE